MVTKQLDGIICEECANWGQTHTNENHKHDSAETIVKMEETDEEVTTKVPVLATVE